MGKSSASTSMADPASDCSSSASIWEMRLSSRNGQSSILRSCFYLTCSISIAPIARELALGERKRLLRSAMKWNEIVLWTPLTREKGIALFEKACAEGGEGIVAKQLNSRYTGDRSGAWLKIKC